MPKGRQGLDWTLRAEDGIKDSKGKVTLNLEFKAPNLAPAFTSILQIVWCRKFSDISKLSVSDLYEVGRRPVLRLQGESST